MKLNHRLLKLKKSNKNKKRKNHHQIQNLIHMKIINQINKKYQLKSHHKKKKSQKLKKQKQHQKLKKNH